VFVVAVLEFLLAEAAAALSVGCFGIDTEGIGPLRMIFARDRVTTFAKTWEEFDSAVWGVDPHRTKGVLGLASSPFPSIMMTTHRVNNFNHINDIVMSSVGEIDFGIWILGPRCFSFVMRRKRIFECLVIRVLIMTVDDNVTVINEILNLVS
jgi:hypothetical protein